MQARNSLTLLGYESQPVLFAKKLSRADLLDMKVDGPVDRAISIHVWRNHAFESLVPLIKPFCQFGDWSADFHFGPYDDSLMFENVRAADIELVWLDSSRFPLNSNFDHWLDWLRGRLAHLRAISSGVIVLASWMLNDEQDTKLEAAIDRLPDVHYANLRNACDESSVKLLDPRTTALAGTPVGKDAQLVLARKLACQWLPAGFLPPIKAVAVDLDNTLHRGILGEDGISGVEVTTEHAELQRLLKSLTVKGIFVALVSRNERTDVEELFRSRRDYHLAWSDFSATEISWGDKVFALESVAAKLRVGTDAILFVDDNPGELEEVNRRLPNLHTIFAMPDAGITSRTILFYPGLWRWKLESDAARRIRDLHANAEREAIAARTVDRADYFREMEVTLTVRLCPTDQLTRLADLCNRTNQFNLALRRFSQLELSERMQNSNSAVVSVALKDRLSESGVIAVVVASHQTNMLIVDELCVSCRALGRRLEDTIVATALQSVPFLHLCREVAFHVEHGPRNMPALTWLGQFSKCGEVPERGLCRIPAHAIVEFKSEPGVCLEIGVESCS